MIVKFHLCAHKGCADYLL